MTQAPAPRPGLLDIVPYVGGESTIVGNERPIKLSSNESAFGPSPRAIRALAEHAGGMHRYPDGETTILRRELGRFYGLDPARIVCGAGSDELIALLARGYAGPGDEIIHTRHGFAMYPINAQAVGATSVAVAETDLTADVDAILAAVNERTRVIFLANPNNPTGSYLPHGELDRLRRGLPGHVLLVIDAAYAEYITRNDYSAGIDSVNAGENTVMTRTFSKIYGLGGVRLGWAYCPAQVAAVLNRIRSPFNVSAPAQVAGVAALADTAFVDAARAHNSRLLESFSTAVRGMGFGVPGSVGNFTLIRFPRDSGRDAAAAVKFLHGRGIIVRAMGGYGLGDHIRVTIGTDEEMAAVTAALRAFAGA